MPEVAKSFGSLFIHNLLYGYLGKSLRDNKTYPNTHAPM